MKQYLKSVHAIYSSFALVNKTLTKLMGQAGSSEMDNHHAINAKDKWTIFMIQSNFKSQLQILKLGLVPSDDWPPHIIQKSTGIDHFWSKLVK